SSAARAWEALMLATLAESVQGAGARLPQAQRVALPGGRWMVRLQWLPGQPASTVLANAPGELRAIIERLATWLERWALGTRRDGIADAARLDQAILQPAARLAPLLTGGNAYVAALCALCERVIGTPLPWVSTHGDLSTSNVLLHGSDPLAIVDWESAR